jgi:hypothetical protein
MSRFSGRKTLTTSFSDLPTSADIKDLALYFQGHEWICTSMKMSRDIDEFRGAPVGGDRTTATFEAELRRPSDREAAGLLEQMEKLRSLVGSNPALNEQYERWENAKILVDLL